MSESGRNSGEVRALGKIALRRRRAILTAGNTPEQRHEALTELSNQMGVPALDLEQVCLRLADLKAVPRELADHHHLVPVLAQSDRLFVAMRDPTNQDAVHEVEFVAGRRVFAYAAPALEVEALIRRAYTAADTADADAFLVGPRCPIETLSRVGLEGPVNGWETMVSRVQVEPPPPSFGGEPAEASSERSTPPQSQPAERIAGAVSAYPPRLSSLPPQLRGSSEPPVALDQEMVDAVGHEFAWEEEPTSTVRVPHERPPGGKQTLLVVDDEPEMRSSLVRVLSAAGYRVRTASDGQEGLRALKEEPPDLLLLDVMLPRVHGFEIVRRLRETERYASIPIIIISAQRHPRDYAQELREGCGVERFIEKPFHVADLVSAVADVLSSHQQANPEADSQGRAEAALKEGMREFRAGNFEQSIVCLERGTKIDPLAHRLHFHLGLLYARVGRLYDGIRTLERAVEIRPRHFGGIKNLAILYCQAGYTRRAAELWERALELAPDHETLQAIREHLDALLSQEDLS